MGLREQIETARGIRPPDLVLTNCRVVNVFSGEVYPADVAIEGHTIVGLGNYEGPRTLDLDGCFLLPGLIDGHVHIESSMVMIPEYARAVVPRGTTTVIVDPHEVANVLGAEGVKFMLASSKNTPLGVFVMVPSCVPASPFETPGARLEAYDLISLLEKRRAFGIGEVMNYPGVLECDTAILDKIRLAHADDLLVDGHAPGLSGHDLCAYVAAGIDSDHESVSPEEAREKIRLGMWLMVREGSTAKNVKDLLPVINELNPQRCFFVTDDRDPSDLLIEGHMDHILRLAVAQKLNPIKAIQMATINTAQYFRLRDLGAVAPRFVADLIAVDNLVDFRVRWVIKRGRVVAQDGRPLFAVPEVDASATTGSVRIADLSLDRLRLPGKPGMCRVIGLIPNQATTLALTEPAPLADGQLVADCDRDILKAAVVERHHATGNVGVALVKGFGLRAGAFASTIAHDAHNIVAVGVDDEDILLAIHKVVEMQGGLAVACRGDVLGTLPLPIAGLMSPIPIDEVRSRLARLERELANLGCQVPHPFMSLAFIALSVLPALKLTDRGLVDVTQFRFVPVQD